MCKSVTPASFCYIDKKWVMRTSLPTLWPDPVVPTKEELCCCSFFLVSLENVSLCKLTGHLQRTCCIVWSPRRHKSRYKWAQECRGKIKDQDIWSNHWLNQLSFYVMSLCSAAVNGSREILLWCFVGFLSQRLRHRGWYRWYRCEILHWGQWKLFHHSVIYIQINSIKSKAECSMRWVERAVITLFSGEGEMSERYRPSKWQILYSEKSEKILARAFALLLKKTS